MYIVMCKVRGKNYKTRSALNGHAWTEPGTILTHTFSSRAGGTHKNIRRSDSIRIRFSAELSHEGLINIHQTFLLKSKSYAGFKSTIFNHNYKISFLNMKEQVHVHSWFVHVKKNGQNKQMNPVVSKKKSFGHLAKKN